MPNAPIISSDRILSASDFSLIKFVLSSKSICDYHSPSFLEINILHSVTDAEALAAFRMLWQLEGIIPALSTAHAIAYLNTLCPQLNGTPKIVINCSGRGDKDVQSVAKIRD